MARFKDHFSSQAADYASCRPTYPHALGEYLRQISPEAGLVWEAGCGSGQLSPLLAERFPRVAATDASPQQLGQAPGHPRIAFWCAAAEASALPPGTADLAVTAQAAHWFDLDAYYGEVRRVAKRGAAIVLITYGSVRLDARLDPLLDGYGRLIAPFWPPERRYVEEGYRSFPFPFQELPTPSLEMEMHWDFEQFLGYLGTSSAVKAMEKRQGLEPVRAFQRRLASAWGRPETVRRIHWPLTLRAGRL